MRVSAVATTAKKDASSTNSTSTDSSKLAAKLTPEIAKDLYYDMVLGREFEEMCAQMYYRWGGGWGSTRAAHGPVQQDVPRLAAAAFLQSCRLDRAAGGQEAAVRQGRRGFARYQSRTMPTVLPWHGIVAHEDCSITVSWLQ